MVARVHSTQIIGLKTDIIDIEVDTAKGLRSFAIVGLPDKAVEEARDRSSAAIKNSGFQSPQKGNKKIIVSLAPANLKKEGSAFDLGIALGYLLANNEIRFEPKGRIFAGELALDGRLRPINGALLLAKLAKEKGFAEIYLPAEHAAEEILEPEHAEDVLDVHAREVVHARPAEPFVTELVVLLALLRIAEDLVGLGALLELRLGFLVARVLVRVILDRQATVGAFDLVGRGVLLDAQDGVVVPCGHKR